MRKVSKRDTGAAASGMHTQCAGMRLRKCIPLKYTFVQLSLWNTTKTKRYTSTGKQPENSSTLLHDHSVRMSRAVIARERVSPLR